MECSEVRELLSPMSDREVAADELRIVEEHLRTCKECAFQSSMIVGLKRLLGRWDGVHASEHFRAAILDRVRKEPPPKRTNWVPWALGGGLATICVVVIVLAFCWDWRNVAAGNMPSPFQWPLFLAGLIGGFACFVCGTFRSPESTGNRQSG